MPDLYDDPEYVWGELNRLAEVQEAAQWAQFAHLAFIATALLVAALTFYLLAQLLTRRQQQLQRVLALPQGTSLHMCINILWFSFGITTMMLLVGLVVTLSMSVSHLLWK